MKNVMFVLVTAMCLTACNPNMWQGHPGKDGAKGDSGERGEVGPQGPAGADGQPGQSCSVLKLGSVTNITCGDSVVQVNDGVDGQNGQGMETLALCPELQGGTFTEYLLKINGNFYGVYSAGNLVGLSKLYPGSWVTTDGRNCYFTITADGQLQ